MVRSRMLSEKVHCTDARNSKSGYATSHAKHPGWYVDLGFGGGAHLVEQHADALVGVGPERVSRHPDTRPRRAGANKKSVPRGAPMQHVAPRRNQ